MAGAEGCGAGAGEDLEDEKGDNTTTNNGDDQQHTTIKYGGGRRKAETVAATVTEYESTGARDVFVGGQDEDQRHEGQVDGHQSALRRDARA